MSYGSDTWYIGRIYEELEKLRLRLANFHLHILIRGLIRKVH